MSGQEVAERLLIMLPGTDSGQSYSKQQLTDMLAVAGLKDIQRLPLQLPNDFGFFKIS